MRCRHVGDQIHHGISIVILGQHGWMLGKHRVGFDGEVIDRNVRRLEAQGGFDVLRQVGQCLTRQGIHHIQIEGVKSCLRFFHCRHGLITVVHTTQSF